MTRIIKQPYLCVGLLALIACRASAQGASAQPVFEVASVKINKSSVGSATPSGRGGSLRVLGGELVAGDVSLWKYIAMAYGVSEDRDYVVSGPDWLKSERFDIIAKFPSDMPQDPTLKRAQALLMLQTLLAERFQLLVHRESKIVPGYALIQAKGGSKLQEVEAGPGRTQQRDGRFTAQRTSMVRLADFLSRFADRAVDDRTELKGVFDFTLQWALDENQSQGGGQHSGASGPSLFTALEEQLGLKLEPQKISVGIIVVDHVEKAPVTN
jgi:uncharacterized protein (TIGR03435 family)